MIVCQQCSTQNEDGAMFCDNCGAQLPQPGVAQPAVAPAVPAGGGVAYSPASPAAGGVQCTQCGQALPPGAMFCDNCGAPIAAVPSPTPTPVAGIPVPPPPLPVTPVAPAAVPQVYGATAAPRLVVLSSNAEIPLEAGKNEYIIGREDPVSNTFPEVDMTPHGGDEGGVSRRHARIYQQGGQWVIDDLGSTNFTFVDNQKVLPNNPVVLSNGSSVRFGKIKTTFYIQ